MLKRMADIDVKQGIRSILLRIEQASAKRPLELQCIQPTLVAVSKTKPAEMVVDAYAAGQRHFGENYAKELCEKGETPEILHNCPDIKWHFIGRLQRNKINKILAVPKLYMIETIDSKKLADALDTAWPKYRPEGEEKLRVMVQVNTSNEEEKNGLDAPEAIELSKHIMESCKNLNLHGLMTIGKFGYDWSQAPNPDFLALVKCRLDLCQKLNLDWKNVHLSMGMSDDFEHAIELGSTVVRVGSSIFGHRAKKE